MPSCTDTIIELADEALSVDQEWYTAGCLNDRGHSPIDSNYIEFMTPERAKQMALLLQNVIEAIKDSHSEIYGTSQIARVLAAYEDFDKGK